MPLFRIYLITFTLFLMACVARPNTVPYLVIQRGDGFYNQIKEGDENRDEVLEDSRDTYQSVTCLESEACQDTCHELYSRQFAREDCETLTKTQVRKLEEVYSTLGSPGKRKLEELSLYDLSVFLNVSPEPIEKLFRRTGSADAKDVLYWIAANKDVADIFEGEDGDFVILETLLNELKSNSIDALSSSIKKGDTFQEVAIIEKNTAAFNWIHSFLESECSSRNRNDNEEWCVLGNYCSIVRKFDEDNAAALLDFEEVAGLVENVIEDPPRRSRYDGIEDIEDVIDLYQDVCISFCSEVNEC